MTASGRQLRGRHVLMILLGAFGVIILANLALTVAAVRSFPGMDIKNSYVASQQFEAKRMSQERLGWQSHAEYGDGTLSVAVNTVNDRPAQLEDLSIRIGRPTHQRSDQWPDFRFDGSHYTAAIMLEPGYWNIDLRASALDGTAFTQQLTLWVSLNR